MLIASTEVQKVFVLMVQPDTQMHKNYSKCLVGAVSNIYDD